MKSPIQSPLTSPSSPTLIHLYLSGFSGKMGQALQSEIQFQNQSTSDFQIIPMDRVKFLNEIHTTDIVIDFSHPTRSLELVQKLLEHFQGLSLQSSTPHTHSPKTLVIGTTGFDKLLSKQDLILFNSELIQLSKFLPVLKASNFSIPFYCWLEQLKNTVHTLQSSQQKILEIKIIETHHIHKKDSPSGTALWISSVLEPLFKNILIESHRQGEVLGIHEVVIKTIDETLYFKHEVHSRQTFARGALEAALFLSQLAQISQNTTQNAAPQKDFQKIFIPHKILTMDEFIRLRIHPSTRYN